MNTKKRDTSSKKVKSLKRRLSHLLEDKSHLDHPLLKSLQTWSLLSDFIKDMVGPEIHYQWFSRMKPLALKDNTLLVECESVFASQWVTMHYQELVDALMKVLNPKVQCYFIAPQNRL